MWAFATLEIKSIIYLFILFIYSLLFREMTTEYIIYLKDGFLVSFHMEFRWYTHFFPGCERRNEHLPSRRHFLSRGSLLTLACAFICNRIDYCNRSSKLCLLKSLTSLFSDFSSICQFCHSCLIRNRAAKCVCDTGYYVDDNKCKCNPGFVPVDEKCIS